MATVYSIKIKSVSAWVNYTPEVIEKKIVEFLEDKKNLNMENVEITVIREA